MTPERLLSVQEVAQRVGLKHQAVRRAINRGDLDAVKLCGRVRVEPAALAVWIDRNRRRDLNTPSSVGPDAVAAKSSIGLRRMLDSP